MSHCVAFGCSNNARKKIPGISFHRFPKNDRRRNIWIKNVSRQNLPHSEYSLILCSEHFNSDCFIQNPTSSLKASLNMRTCKQLKPDAIPTLFTHKPSTTTTRDHTEKRIKLKDRNEMITNLLSTNQTVPGSNASVAVSKTPVFPVLLPEPCILSQPKTCILRKPMTADKSTQTDTLSTICSCQRELVPVIALVEPVPIVTNEKSNAAIPDNPIAPVASSSPLHIPLPTSSNIYDDDTAVNSDDSFKLHSSDTESSNSEFSTEEENSKETASPIKNLTSFLIFETKLHELFKRCQMCGSLIIDHHYHYQGSMISISTKCTLNHKCIWQSQPLIKKRAAGNLLLASAILFSGNTFQKIEKFSQLLHLMFISKKTFYTIQNTFLYPTINDTWCIERNTRMQYFKAQDIKLGLIGDGCCDSPEFSAKYCSYTFMEENSSSIIDFQLVQVTEAGNSVGMEKVGFQRSLKTILEKEIKIKHIATDRHGQIAALMRKDYNKIPHQFDIWHFSRNVLKKLIAKSRKKDCESLGSWIQSIYNHLWWCSATCGNDENVLKEKWISLLHHITNQHQWASPTSIYNECEHGVLTSTVHNDFEVEWLTPGSPAHKALKEIVLNKRLLTDLKKLTNFCHTGQLEVYHSLLTKYCPKREHFSYKGMQARMQLAALDHNRNIGRNQKCNAEGEPQFKLEHIKRKKNWVAKAIYENKSYDFAYELIETVIAHSYDDNTKWLQ